MFKVFKALSGNVVSSEIYFLPINFDWIFFGALVTRSIAVKHINFFPFSEKIVRMFWKNVFWKRNSGWMFWRTSQRRFGPLKAVLKCALLIKPITPSSTLKEKKDTRRIASSGDEVRSRRPIKAEGRGCVQLDMVICFDNFLSLLIRLVHDIRFLIINRMMWLNA